LPRKPRFPPEDVDGRDEPGHDVRDAKARIACGRAASAAVLPAGRGVALQTFSKFFFGNRLDCKGASEISLILRRLLQAFPNFYLADSWDFRGLSPKKFGNRVF
jgi:hypothetical protein